MSDQPETEFHMNIGVTVRRKDDNTVLTPYIVSAVQELVHSRAFRSGIIKKGVIAEHENDFRDVVTTTTLNFGRRALRKAGLAPHQQRVVDEKADRDDEIERLAEFIARNPIFGQQSADEQARLRRQLDVMRELSFILAERISNFAGPAESTCVVSEAQ